VIRSSVVVEILKVDSLPRCIVLVFCPLNNIHILEIYSTQEYFVVYCMMVFLVRLRWDSSFNVQAQEVTRGTESQSPPHVLHKDSARQHLISVTHSNSTRYAPLL